MPTEPPRMTPEDIKTTTLGLVKGTIFAASMAPPDLITSIFMPLALGGLGDIDITKIGNIIEDLSKAGHYGINGYPTFLSCTVVHKDDWKVIIERVQKAQAALDAALGEDDPPDDHGQQQS